MRSMTGWIWPARYMATTSSRSSIVKSRSSIVPQQALVIVQQALVIVASYGVVKKLHSVTPPAMLGTSYQLGRCPGRESNPHST